MEAEESKEEEENSVEEEECLNPEMCAHLFTVKKNLLPFLD
jgi:hypothetical protein